MTFDPSVRCAIATGYAIPRVSGPALWRSGSVGGSRRLERLHGKGWGPTFPWQLARVCSHRLCEPWRCPRLCATDISYDDLRYLHSIGYQPNFFRSPDRLRKYPGGPTRGLFLESFGTIILDRKSETVWVGGHKHAEPAAQISSMPSPFHSAGG